jgi:hypothetical protein
MQNAKKYNLARVTQFAGRVGLQGRIETKNRTVWLPNLVSIRPPAYSTDGLAANRVTPALLSADP